MYYLTDYLTDYDIILHHCNLHYNTVALVKSKVCHIYCTCTYSFEVVFDLCTSLRCSSVRRKCDVPVSAGTVSEEHPKKEHRI